MSVSGVSDEFQWDPINKREWSLSLSYSSKKMHCKHCTASLLGLKSQTNEIKLKKFHTDFSFNFYKPFQTVIHN